SQEASDLAVWHANEATASQNFVAALAPWPTASRWRFLQPTAYASMPISGHELLAQPQLEPVLAAPVEEQFFVAQADAAAPAYGTREFWETQPRPALNITRHTTMRDVSAAFAAIDTRFPLRTIPALVPNAAAPPFAPIELIYGRFGATTSAQHARINLRVNLI